MIKCITLLPKRPDISAEQFHAHWRGIHAELAKRIPTIRRYVQSHGLPEPVPAMATAPFAGAPEVWLDDFETAGRMRESVEYRTGAMLDEPKFIDVPGIVRLATQESVVLAGPPVSRDTPAVKGLLLLKRRPGMSVEQFQQRWRDSHAPLVQRLPQLMRYVQCTPLAQTYTDSSEPAYDGVEELWWPDLEAFRACCAGPEWQAAQVENLRLFADTDRSTAFLAEENRVIWT